MNTKATQGRFAWNQFPKLKNSEELENYIKYRITNGKEGKCGNLRAYHHGGFFHYTKLNSIEKILKDKRFLMFHPGDSNDPEEKEILEKEHKFYLCFSTGVNENLPLWYLYAGVKGKGGCIRFTQSMIYELIEKGEFSLVELEDDKKIVKGMEYEKKLEKDEYECTLQDVVYAGDSKKGNFENLKYNTMTNYDQITKDEYKKFKNNNQEFVKSLIWYYEKETRLLLKLTEKGIKKLEQGKKYAVSIRFPKQVYKKINLVLAPEIKEIEKIINSEKYPEIKKFISDTSSVRLSEHQGQVEMKLCEGCQNA